MRRLAGFALLCILAAGASWACGDKYLVRCVVNRSDAPVAGAGDAGRLVIIDDGSDTVKRLIDLGLQNELTARGFKVYIVGNRNELAEVVAAARLDLAVVDWRKIDEYTPSLTRGTPVLPVIGQGASAQLPALREKYATILKVPGQKSTSLATVDIAIRDARKTL